MSDSEELASLKSESDKLEVELELELESSGFRVLHSVQLRSTLFLAIFDAVRLVLSIPRFPKRELSVILHSKSSKSCSAALYWYVSANPYAHSLARIFS